MPCKLFAAMVEWMAWSCGWRLPGMEVCGEGQNGLSVVSVRLRSFVRVNFGG